MRATAVVIRTGATAGIIELITNIMRAGGYSRSRD